MDISLPARVLFSIGPLPITDAFLGAVLVSITLVLFSVLAVKRFSLVPTRLQFFLEMIAEYLLEQLEQAFGSKSEARKFFPLIMTLLLFIVIANQFTLIPLIFDITYNGVDVLRQPTSDLAGTIALSLLVVGLAHVLALRISPLRHLSNFFPIHKFFKVRSIGDFFYACVDMFIGFLNIIGELAKVVSLAARLFGNIFAGNVMVAVIASLFAFTLYIFPIPFIMLSVFSGFIQAFVFMLLSMQFIAMTIDGAKPDDGELEAAA
jgi:F-type H+-transporting ATPase subunit a